MSVRQAPPPNRHDIHMLCSAHSLSERSILKWVSSFRRRNSGCQVPDLTTSFLLRQESRVVGAVREPPAPSLCEPFTKPGEEKARQSTHSSDHITPPREAVRNVNVSASSGKMASFKKLQFLESSDSLSGEVVPYSLGLPWIPSCQTVSWMLSCLHNPFNTIQNSIYA